MDLSNWTLSPHNPLLRPSKAEDSAVMAGSLLQGGGGIAEGDRACGPNGALGSVSNRLPVDIGMVVAC